MITSDQIETHFNQAIAGLESDSIRKWAVSPRNRPLFIEFTEKTLKKNPKSSVHDLTTVILMSAIGL